MSHLADELGAIKAQIADLKLREAAIKTDLHRIGGVHEGALFRATVSESIRATVDWKSIAQKLKPSRQLVTANTTTKPVITVRVTSRIAA